MIYKEPSTGQQADKSISPPICQKTCQSIDAQSLIHIQPIDIIAL
jgi:hypothetical protein